MSERGISSRDKRLAKRAPNACASDSRVKMTSLTMWRKIGSCPTSVSASVRKVAQISSRSRSAKAVVFLLAASPEV